MSVHQLTPLPVVVPLLTAAAIAITSAAQRRVHDAMATSAAAGTTALCAVLRAHSRSGPIVEWLGGWRPHHGVAIGISLTADQLGAGAAMFAGAIVTAALVYSWAYFDELDGLVHALILVLCAALVGLCLTGDLFTMIVFFVLGTVSAIALTAVENEHTGPLQGAINFGVVNSVAGFALLFGAALVYGRTGALNLAQIGLSLDHHPADALVAVSFALLMFGLLTKAGIAPFHFWLPDAQAVAPTPVSTVMSSAMVVTVLLAAARLLSTAFAQPLDAHEDALRAVLVGAGAVTAVLAAVTCFQQRHIKRLLAFATAAHVGATLCGIGLMSDEALAGAALNALGFGLAIASLFGAAGVLLRRYGTSDEFQLAGCGRDLPLTGATFVIGGLALAALPPSAGFYGQWLIADGARDAGYGWLPALLALTAALTSAAILRVTGRVFFGWGISRPEGGRVESEERSQEESSSEEERDMGTSGRPSVVLAVVPLALLVAAITIGAPPGFVASVEGAAAHFRDTGSYIAAVLSNRRPHYAPVPAHGIDLLAWLFAGASLTGAALMAWAGLRGRRLAPSPVVDALRAAHSGHVGDYVAWWTFGMTVLGGLTLWAVSG